MKLFDTSYLKPKKLISIVVIFFILLAGIGYGVALNSEAHVIAKKAIEQQDPTVKTKPKVTLLPWGFKIRHIEDDGDAHLTYYVSSDTGSRIVSVILIKKDGQWKLTELPPL